MVQVFSLFIIHDVQKAYTKLTIKLRTYIVAHKLLLQDIILYRNTGIRMENTIKI